MQYLRFFLAVTLLGASASSLRAQSGEGQTRRERTAQIEARIERLRRDIETLQRRRMDAELQRSRSETDSVVRSLDRQIGRTERTLAALQTSLVRESIEQRLRNGDSTAVLVWRARTEAMRQLQESGNPWPASGGGASGVGGGESDRTPSGWVGISFSGSTRSVYSRSKGLLMYHDDYPIIESVEPGSPAERAGLQAGDTVLAYDGRDVRKRWIPLGKQIRPGVRLVVRVERDGEVKEIPVAVERRPVTFSPTYTLVVPSPAPTPIAAAAAPLELLAPPDRVRIRDSRRGEAGTDVRPVAPRAPSRGTVPVPSAPLAPTPPAAVAPPSILFTPGWKPIVAGAELTGMNAGLRDVFGVKGGVLVLSVAPGSPAAGAGLRSGDVVLRVNDRTVASPQAVQRAIQECQTRAARLELVRKQKEKRLTLRW